MTTAGSSIAFGDANSSLQVGQCLAPISAEFHLPPERVETPPLPCSTVPLLRDPNYVSRQTLLDEVDTRASVPGARVAVVGLGGTGKTQLAIEYADWIHQRDPNTWIIWITARNAARIQQSVSDVADRLKIQGRSDPNADVLSLLKRWLGDKSKGRWLAVLDNFDEADVLTSFHADLGKRGRLTEYFPVCDHGSVLITTRSLVVARKLVYEEQIVLVGPMNAEHASELLEKKLGSGERQEHQRLSVALDFLPLAMSQAAAYLRRRGPRASVQRYLRDIEKNHCSRTRLLNRGAELPDCDWEASKSVITTWQISFEHIYLIRKSAADLLSLMSMCDRQVIPEILLRNVKSETESVHSDDDSDEARSLDDMREVEDGFEDDIEMLVDFSFISPTTSETDWTMHRLVQDATRVWIKNQGRYQMIQDQFLHNFSAVLPFNMLGTWKKWQDFLPHLRRVIEQKPNDRRALLEWADVMARAAHYSLTIGDWKQGESLATESLHVRMKYLGKVSSRTMHSQLMMAAVCAFQTKLDQCEQIISEVVETSKATSGGDEIFAILVKHYLADIYWWNGRLGEVGTLRAGNVDPAILDTGGFLAYVSPYAWAHLWKGRFEEAEELLLQTILMRKEKLGADHTDTLNSTNQLALAYLEQNRLAEAEVLQLEVVAKTTVRLGSDHLRTIGSMLGLAITYCKQKRFEDAEALCEEVVKSRTAALGTDHVYTLEGIVWLAEIYEGQQRWEKAGECYQLLLKASTAKYGADDSKTAERMADVAWMYYRQKRWEEARELQEQIIERHARVLGLLHPDTLSATFDLARIYEGQERWPEAEKLHKQVADSRTAELGADHPDTLRSMVQLARTYHKQKRSQDATVLQEEAVEGYRKTHGSQHSYTLEEICVLACYQSNWAGAYSREDRWTEARALQEQAVEGYKNSYGTEHPDTLEEIFWLARYQKRCAKLHSQQNRWTEAKVQQELAVENYKSARGADHPDTLDQTLRLAEYQTECANTYYKQEKWSEAKALQEQAVEVYRGVRGKEHPRTLEEISWLENYRRMCTLTLEGDSLALWESQEMLVHSGCLSPKQNVSRLLIAGWMKANTHGSFPPIEILIKGRLQPHHSPQPAGLIEHTGKGAAQSHDAGSEEEQATQRHDDHTGPEVLDRNEYNHAPISLAVSQKEYPYCFILEPAAV